MSGPRFIGGLINPYPTLEGYILTKGGTITFTPMPALQVDVTLPGNSYVATGDVAFTYSAATHLAYTPFHLRISADGTARTITLPYNHWSTNRNGNLTTLLVPANGTLEVVIWYTGARWEIFNDPVATTGTAGSSFVLATAPTIYNQTISGYALMSENSSIELDRALSSAGTYCGITEYGTAGAALEFGHLCYFDGAKWALTDADAEATSGPVKLGICVLAASGDTEPTMMLLWGKVRRDTTVYDLTAGSPVYVGLSAGVPTKTKPSVAGDFVRVIGFGNTATELFFCPSNEYIELA